MNTKAFPKLLLLIPNLNFGGAQRVFFSHSIELSKHFQVIECVFNFDEGYAYQSGNEVVSLEVSGGNNFISKLRALYLRYKRLKELKQKLLPNICISHLEGADLVNILSQHKEKTITWVHGSKVHDENIEGLLGLLRHRVLIPFTYKRADRVVTVSKEIKNELVIQYKVSAAKIETVYNYFDISTIQSKSAMPIDALFETIFSGNNTLVFSGRLVRQKNLDNLLKWFVLFNQPRSYKLVIIGDGDLRDSLLKLCIELHLKVYTVWNNGIPDNHQDVYFLGFRDNPFNLIARSTAFILPSFWEGFPMALGEAMACGIPVIAADCPTGPREMFSRDEENYTGAPYFAQYGLLLPILKKDSFEQWSSNIRILLNDKNKLAHYRNKSMERANDFSQTNAQRLIALVNSVL